MTATRKAVALALLFILILAAVELSCFAPRDTPTGPW